MSAAIEFKPSQVFLGQLLVASFGRAEREAAALLFVRACQVNGDEWQALTPRTVGEAIRADLDAGREPLASLNRNPFFRPDFWSLVAEGFARWTGDAGGPLELTGKGLEALRRWALLPHAQGGTPSTGGGAE